MASKVLILPNYQGQELPSDGLDRFDHIYLVTETQETLPVNVVMQLLQLTNKLHVDIQFMQLSYSTETELLFTLAFQVAQMSAAEPDVQITFVTENLSFDSLVSVGKKAGYKLARADGFTRLSTVPQSTEAPKPIQPNVVQPKVAPKPVEPVETTEKEEVSQPVAEAKTEETAGNKNKKLIASLLNNK